MFAESSFGVVFVGLTIYIFYLIPVQLTGIRTVQWYDIVNAKGPFLRKQAFFW